MITPKLFGVITPKESLASRPVADLVLPAWQQLRASAALLAEWLKICFREGWLGSARRNIKLPYTRNAKRSLDSFLGYRYFLGLDAQAVGQVPPKKDVKAPPGDEGPPDDAGPPGFVAGDDLPF